MTDAKDGRMKEIIREFAAEYFSRVANSFNSLITVTDVELRNRNSKAIILVTVLPASEEEKAVAFLHRQLGDLRDYVMQRAKLMRVPYFEVAIDKGEKNRQRLEDIANNIDGDSKTI